MTHDNEVKISLLALLAKGQKSLWNGTTCRRPSVRPNVRRP